MPPTVSPESIGYERGLRDGLHNGIRSCLKVKFGGQGEELFWEVRWMKDVTLLQIALEAIEGAATPDDWMRAWCPESLDVQKPLSFLNTFERQGFEKGLCRGLLTTIEAVLEIKFGASGLRLMPEFRPLQDLAQLRWLLHTVKRAASVDDVKRAWSG